MTTLIQRMREELVRRNYSPSAIRTYLQAVQSFQQHAGKPLDDLGPDDTRRYQVHLLEDRRLANGTVVLHVSALRFLYRCLTDRQKLRATESINEKGEGRRGVRSTA